MKNKNKPHYSIMAVVAVLLTVGIWSCNKNDDPSLQDLRTDKLSYLQDSIRIADSLKRINAAGIINYSITVVSGSTSSLYKNGNGGGRSKENLAAIEGATVTIGQFGKTQTATTDASGMVVFNGYFRAAVNVTIVKEGFTKVSYVSVVKDKDNTENGGIFSVGNIIPLFELTGANTATISGKATIQTNLTNKTRELAPDGTTIKASINAMDYNFGRMFLTDNLYFEVYDESEGYYYDYYAGHIIDASYETGVLGTVAGGNYTITVPAAIDGLPLQLQYSDIAADQTLFEYTGDGDPFNQVLTYRTIYEGSGYSPSGINPAGSVTVSFNAGTGAAASAVVSLPETIDRFNVTAGGTGYSGVPTVLITGGGGTGASATAVVTNGVVTGINLVSGGTNYTSVPTVSLVSGTGATAATTLNVDGTVTGVALTNTGAGYTTAPVVTFSAPGGAGTTATGTATIDGSGRVTGVTITSPGSGYTGNPTVAFTAAPAGGVTATANGIYSGQSVANVSVTGGSSYTYAPSVTFDPPQRSNGVRATGTATFDASTRQVTGIIVTNPGSGYTSAPGVTLNAGSGATVQAVLTGGSVISANVTGQGTNYVAAPAVTFTGGGGGSGATGTAVIADGKLIGINITSGGSGYTSAPTISLSSGTGAQGFASIVNGGVSAVTVVNGGTGYTGAPIVSFTSSLGSGAAGTATIAGGQVTGVTVSAAGTGYVEGNIPSGSGENFSATKGWSIWTYPGIKYINDVYYGTGVRQPR